MVTKWKCNKCGKEFDVDTTKSIQIPIRGRYLANFIDVNIHVYSDTHSGPHFCPSCKIEVVEIYLRAMKPEYERLARLLKRFPH